MQVGQDLNRWWKGGLTLCPLIEFLALNELNPANTARCGQLIVLWPRACVWNTTNARTTLEAIFWDATTILSRLTFFLEIFSILKMETSAWLSASKNVEKLVSCLLGSGEIVLNSDSPKLKFSGTASSATVAMLSLHWSSWEVGTCVGLLALPHQCLHHLSLELLRTVVLPCTQWSVFIHF